MSASRGVAPIQREENRMKPSLKISLTPAARLVAFLAAAVLACGPAAAQEYPAKDIHAICNFPAGSGADVFVRYFSEKLSALAGRPVIVENKGGALGNIGTEATAKSR